MYGDGPMMKAVPLLEAVERLTPEQRREAVNEFMKAWIRSGALVPWTESK